MANNNYAHKFDKIEWQIIATARECHLHLIFEKNNKEVEKAKCLKKQAKKRRGKYWKKINYYFQTIFLECSKNEFF